MRLIDADVLKNTLNSGGGETVDINICKSMPLGEIADIVIQAYRKCLFAELEKMPTAYDVDKVMEQLGVAFEAIVAEILDGTGSEFTIGDFNIRKYTDVLTGIVKAGMKE